MSHYYDRLGNPISIERFSVLFEDYDYKVIEKTPMVLGDDPIEVSTVWLGIDHSFGRGAPILFETMVFGGPHHGDQQRYCTEAEAREGHMLKVQALAAEFHGTN